MARPPVALGARKAPRQTRAAHTVDALLEAAALVLEEGGLAGFNTNAIARRAGASIGTLYQYFPSKDALTLALLQREEGKFRTAAAAASALPDWREAMDAFIAVAAQQQLARPHLARLLDQQEGRPDIRAALNQGPSFYVLMADILAKPEAPGHACDAAQLTQAAADLLAIIRGMTDAAGERGERDADDLARRIRGSVSGYLNVLT
ncbi:TetR/AcrR family transcriptional regulator [Duganella callida]|uniref:TetR/AcrR family transcriptional regulator n=1 Tax=Duganella callida TaxID=2561932 RepID=A0A4Y9SH08_9BURK|nr:TetR/AcrR family transcriptional regulator [Duganella callida]TFW23726.1 TetR/AcrR family transcriptional regulator [Duganella callida]